MGNMLWFERTFPNGLDVGLTASILERLRGMPVRLAEKLAADDVSFRQRSNDESWSIQEHAGHLFDLEPLWLTRFREFNEDLTTLSPADLTNRRTHNAQHNAVTLDSILTSFGNERAEIVSFLEDQPREFFGRSALHPRLKTAMSPVDLMYFVAEHDDHHLAAIARLLSTP